MLVERWGSRAWGRADGGSVACPPFMQEATQPQEAYQQEVVEKEVVYHSVSLLLGKNDDRLPDT